MTKSLVFLPTAVLLGALALSGCGEATEATTTSLQVQETKTSAAARETTTSSPAEAPTPDDASALTEIDYNEGADWESVKGLMGETVVVIGTVVAVQGDPGGEFPALDGSDQIQIYLGSAEMLDEPLNPQNRFVAAIPPDSLGQFPYMVNLQANTEGGLGLLMGGTVKVTGELYLNSYEGAGVLCTQKGQLLFGERDGWVE